MPGGGPLCRAPRATLDHDDGRSGSSSRASTATRRSPPTARTLTVYDATAKKVYRGALPAGEGSGEPTRRPTPAESSRASTASRRRRRCRARRRPPRRPPELHRADRAEARRRAARRRRAGVGRRERRAAARRRLRPGPVGSRARAQGHRHLVRRGRRRRPRVVRALGREAVNVDPPAGHDAKGAGKHEDVTGVAAVQKRLGFDLSAPAKLAGLPRNEVRLVHFGGEKARSCIRRGPRRLIVLQRQAGQPARRPATRGGALPQVNIDGATGDRARHRARHVRDLRARRRPYTVLGSVPPAAAENAARGLR